MMCKKRQLHIFRLTAFILLLAICAGWAIPARAVDSGSCGEKVSWQLSGGVLFLSGTGEMENYSEASPAPWADRLPSITQVYVGEGITRLGSRAFDGGENLMGISLPSTLTEIGERTFRDCRKLESIRLPDGLRIIGEGAFESCESLWGLRIPYGVETIRNFAFYRCSSLTSITVPETVLFFGVVVFSYCTGMTQAAILSPLVKLPDSTFFGCTSLTTVILPPTMTTLGTNTFHNCGELSMVYCPGADENDLLNQIKQDETVSNEVYVESSDDTGNGSSYGYKDSEDDDSFGGTGTKTTETENSTINIVTESSTTITIGGVPITPSDLATEPTIPIPTEPSNTTDPTQPSDPDEELVDLPQDVQIETSTEQSTHIEATLNNDDGWQDLLDAVTEQRQNDNNDFDVTVNLPGSTVSGNNLSKLAGQNVQLVTDSGSIWELSSDNKRTDYQNKEYDLGITVTQVDQDKSPIQSDTVYKVNFADNVDFNATVGIHVGNAREIATLHQKVGREYQEIQTVIVDKNGTAWFDLAGTNAKSDFYVSINAEGADRENAKIPKNLYGDYGMTADGATLMDASGKYYEVVGVNSSLGVDLKTFMMYVGVALAGVILVVAIVMVSLNHSKKMKQRYAKGAKKKGSAKPKAQPEEEQIDMDELRLKVMQDLLEEQKRQNREK